MKHRRVHDSVMLLQNGWVVVGHHDIHPGMVLLAAMEARSLYKII